jgi:DNA-binding NtrC family response regulator
MPAEGEQPTVVQPHDQAQAERACAFTLVVVEGADRGLTLTVDGSSASRALIGTSPACDLRLTDPAVSRRHTALECAGGELHIVDLESTNGTYVDHVRVVEAYLQGDELVRIGASMLRVERADAVAVAEPPPATSFGRVFGVSREMRRLFPLCARLAASSVPVVIEGETGTGKEVLAESIHDAGPRASGPFVVFDCTATPVGMIEAELFGHERGAFTGAVGHRKGLFEVAHGGTLLIDEIGDLDISLQAKLLRAIERGEVRRIGASAWSRVDVRVLAATRRDLDHEVQVGRFRDDLFHRLAVGRIEMPPLRRRKGDILPLARAFWAELGGEGAGPPTDLLRRWEEYSWPGNVRELRNAVARQIALGEPWHPPGGRQDDSQAARAIAYDQLIDQGLPFTRARDKVLSEFEQRYVERMFDRFDGDMALAAAASGIGRRYFQKLRARSSR